MDKNSSVDCTKAFVDEAEQAVRGKGEVRGYERVKHCAVWEDK